MDQRDILTINRYQCSSLEQTSCTVEIKQTLSAVLVYFSDTFDNNEIFTEMDTQLRVWERERDAIYLEYCW